jgi:hypothetical protein
VPGQEGEAYAGNRIAYFSDRAEGTGVRRSLRSDVVLNCVEDPEFGAAPTALPKNLIF